MHVAMQIIFRFRMCSVVFCWYLGRTSALEQICEGHLNLFHLGVRYLQALRRFFVFAKRSCGATLRVLLSFGSLVLEALSAFRFVALSV